MITIDEIDAFIDRPNGGIEAEMIFAGIEGVVAVSLLALGQDVLRTPIFSPIYWNIPHGIFAIPWLTSSLATISGLLLFRSNNKWCAPLRWFGAFVSAWLWGAVMSIGFSLPGEKTLTQIIVLAVAFFACIWQFRIMVSAWRRQKFHWTNVGG